MIRREFSHLLNVTNTDVKDVEDMERRISPVVLFDLVQLISQSAISGPTAKMVFEEMFNTGKSAQEIVKERGLSQISDTQQLEDTVIEVINSNPKPVADYKSGDCGTT